MKVHLWRIALWFEARLPVFPIKLTNIAQTHTWRPNSSNFGSKTPSTARQQSIRSYLFDHFDDSGRHDFFHCPERASFVRTAVSQLNPSQIQTDGDKYLNLAVPYGPLCKQLVKVLKLIWDHRNHAKNHQAGKSDDDYIFHLFVFVWFDLCHVTM